MPEPLYILGAGMHPWGKWGNDFTEYGVAAARAALNEAGLDWRQIQLVAGAVTIRNGYPGFVAHPYREYSEVFFGDEYKVLRGGSWATRARVATPTFRNWDLPQRRQIFAGVRLAWDA